MKKLTLAAALVLTSIAMSTQAATVAQNFNVTATLTAQCVSNNLAPTDVNFGAYTAFTGPATAAPTSAISFRCTKGLPNPVASLSAGAGTIAGLAYSLAVAAPAKTAGASGAAGTVGTYDVYSYTVTGSMAAGQAGDAAAAATPVVHTLTITY